MSIPLPSIEQVNAASTVVVAVATVVLTWVASLQIKHRNEERREHSQRLDAVAKYHGILMRSRLRDGISALDALLRHNRQLDSWRQQAALADNFLRIAFNRLEEASSAMIERHSATPAVIEEMLQAMLAATDATRELAGPAAPGLNNEEIRGLYATARKQALVTVSRIEAALGLTPLPPMAQPPGAPGSGA